MTLSDFPPIGNGLHHHGTRSAGLHTYGATHVPARASHTHKSLLSDVPVALMKPRRRRLVATACWYEFADSGALP
jgi:hypothetical protein